MSSSTQGAPALDDLQSVDEPVWLWDASRRRVVWSNPAGLAFFGAETLFDLIDRRFSTDEPGVAAIVAVADQLDPGGSGEELLDFPSSVSGEPVTATCQIHKLPDGRDGVLVITKPEVEHTAAPLSGADLINALPQSIAVLTSAGQILQHNAALADLFETGAVSSFAGLIADEELAAEIIRVSLAAGTLSQVKPVVCRYGKRDLRIYAQVLGSGASRQLLVMMEDVTDRRALERRLREHAERLSDFVASAADFTWELDRNLVLTSISDGFTEVTGLSPDSVTGIPWPLLSERHGFDQDGEIRNLLVDQSAWKAEIDWTIDAGTGEAARLFLSAVPGLLPDGSFTGYRGIGAGISRSNAVAAASDGLSPGEPDAPADAQGKEPEAEDNRIPVVSSEEPGDGLTAEDDILNVAGSVSSDLFGQPSGREPDATPRLTPETRFLGDDGITPLDEDDNGTVDALQQNQDGQADSHDSAETDERPSELAGREREEDGPGSPGDADERLSPSERSILSEIGETIARETDDQGEALEQDDDEEDVASPGLEDDAEASAEPSGPDAGLDETGEDVSGQTLGLSTLAGLPDGLVAPEEPVQPGEHGEEQAPEDALEGEQSPDVAAAPEISEDETTDDETDEGEADPLDAAIGSVKAVFDGLPGASVIHRNGEVLHVNPLAASLLGFESQADAVKGNQLIDLFGVYADDLLSSGSESVTFTSVPFESGSVRLTASAAAVPWPDGEAVQITLQSAEQDTPAEDDAHPLPDNVVRLVRDEIKAGSETGGPTNSHLLAMLNTATDGILTLDDQGQVLALNSSAEAMFGYENEEVHGKPLTEFLTRESRDSLERYMAAVADPGIASVLNDGREVTGIEKNGGEIPLFLTLGRLDGGDEDEPARFCAVLRDLTSWKKTETELIEAREAAELASAQKSEFLANISHEIRTPLNAILGFSEVMKARRFGEIDNDKYSTYVNDIHSSGEHLLSLINDLLDLSKVEAGKLELDFSSVDLGEVISQTISLLSETARDARVIVRSSVAGDLPNVVADQRSMRQIMLNLLSNAIKFTDPGGQVVISARLEQDGPLSLKVKDTGRGMTDEQIARAMEPFRQVEEVSDQASPGTGLGLPLTKALAEANRASFDISSEPEVGTVVGISFPTTRVLAE